MPRGNAAPIGATRTSQNGYLYIKEPQGWKLVHQKVAEENLGRPLADNERVRFKDGDRTNLDPENIVVYITKEKSRAARIAELEAKIEVLQAELDSLRES